MHFVMDMIMVLCSILFVVSAFALLDLVLLGSHFINKLRDKFGKEIEVDTGNRIKQMWTKVCQDEMPELDETCMTLQRQEKFAQMIVQECVNSIENNVFTWGLDQAAIKGFCVDAIINQFGDEE
jgi:ABC-type siderophore export system fused ATPase/permease subunit